MSDVEIEFVRENCFACPMDVTFKVTGLPFREDLTVDFYYRHGVARLFAPYGAGSPTVSMEFTNPDDPSADGILSIEVAKKVTLAMLTNTEVDVW